MTLLAWRRSGTPGGSRAVLLHGWGRDGEKEFEGWSEALASHGVEALVCDLPGHGNSADVGIPDGTEPAGWSAQAVEADVVRMVPEGPVAVVGSGLGGLVAAHLAARNSSRFRPLVLVGCDDRAPGSAHVAAALRDRSTRLWDGTMAEIVGDARADHRHDLAALAVWAEQAAWPAAARLGSLRTRVLVAVGADDDRRDGAARLAGLFHDGRLGIVPGGPRAALRAPELVEQVGRFLAEEAAEEAAQEAAREAASKTAGENDGP